jgi:hypothetical protein
MIKAEELFYKMLSQNDECTSSEMMIEFAKLHVEEALKEASKILIEVDGSDFGVKSFYPLDNIK